MGAPQDASHRCQQISDCLEVPPPYPKWSERRKPFVSQRRSRSHARWCPSDLNGNTGPDNRRPPGAAHLATAPSREARAPQFQRGSPGSIAQSCQRCVSAVHRSTLHTPKAPRPQFRKLAPHSTQADPREVSEPPRASSADYVTVSATIQMLQFDSGASRRYVRTRQRGLWGDRQDQGHLQAALYSLSMPRSRNHGRRSPQKRAPPSPRPPPAPPRKWLRADITVAVRFRPQFWPLHTEKEFRFVTRKDSDGVNRWTSAPLWR